MHRTPVTAAALVAAALIAIACSSGGSDTKGPGAQGEPAADTGNAGKQTIVMEVTGAKRADITYGLNTDQSQESDAAVPWKKTLTSSETIAIATVVAQNKGSGSIKCKITFNGKVVKENSSKGQYAVVTCSADNL